MRDRSGRLSGSTRAAGHPDDRPSLPLAVEDRAELAPSGHESPPGRQEPSDAQTNVSDVPDPQTERKAFELPTKKTFNPTPLGHGANIFQFDTKKLRDDVSVPTLVGVVASAKGAPLGSREFDVLTVLSRWFLDAPDDAAREARRAALRAGRSANEADDAAEQARRTVMDSRHIETTMYKLTRTIYGQVSKERYEALGQAIEHLRAVVLRVPGVDLISGTANAHARSDVNLVSAVVITDQQQRFDVARREAPQDLARVFGSAKGQVTLKIELANWLCEAIISRFGADLNFEVQRRLRGAAKSLWVQLEAFRFTEVEGEELECYELPMDEHTFAGLRLNCNRPSDNVAKVRARLKSILEVDPAYVGYEQVRDPDDRRRVRSITVTRATGALRQQRLRTAQLAATTATTDKELVALPTA